MVLRTRVSGSSVTGCGPLLDLVGAIGVGLKVFGRRNRPLRDFPALAHAETGLLPQYLAVSRGVEIPLYTSSDLDAYHQEHPAPVPTAGRRI